MPIPEVTGKSRCCESSVGAFCVVPSETGRRPFLHAAAW